MSHPPQLELTAINGANPLGFLAALGALRLTTLCLPDQRPRLDWIQRSNWIPRLHTEAPVSADELCEQLAKRVASNPAFPEPFSSEAELKKLKLPVDRFRLLISNAVSGRNDYMLEFLAAFFNETSPRDGKALKTRFDFHSGQQKIVDSFESLRANVSTDSIRSALFTGWDYIGVPSLRWDPLDEKRQYALQAIDPTNTARTGNPILAVPGANLLALHGVFLFPPTPDSCGAQAGFNYARHATEWSWPVWNVPCSVLVVQSLLGNTKRLISDRGERLARGVPVVFRSSIGSSGKGYRSFSPAETCA